MTQEDKISARLEECVQAVRQAYRQIRMLIMLSCDGERILRCAGKPSLRNSAKCIRNFGKRMAAGGEDIYCWSCWRRQKRGPSDCLPQTQVPAKAQAEV